MPMKQRLMGVITNDEYDLDCFLGTWSVLSNWRGGVTISNKLSLSFMNLNLNF